MHNEEVETPGQQLGERLRRSREEQGLSLEEIEERTKIWANLLEALEREDFDALPNPLWARGLTVLYAGALGLDGEAFADEFFPSSERPKRSLADRRKAIVAALGRHWKLLTVALGTLVVAISVAAATILDPYGVPASKTNDALHKVAPGTFLGSEPQRIAVFSDTQLGAAGGEGNVMAVKVAQDGIGVLSVPSNTAVEIPDHGKGKISDALAAGGPDLMRRTVAQLTGVDVAYYFDISAEGVRAIVNETGGVRVDVPNLMRGRASVGGPLLQLRPGQQTLDGDEALVYLQGTDLTTEAQRATRQQAFMSEMFAQALDARNLPATPVVLGLVTKYAKTNMSALQVIELAGRFRALKDSDKGVEARAVPGQEGGPAGALWEPDTDKLSDAVKETLR